MTCASGCAECRCPTDAEIRGPVGRPLAFRTQLEKARYLDAAARMDVALEGLQRFVAAQPWRRMDAERRARAIHAWVRDRIAYSCDRVQNPRGRELFLDSVALLRRGHGDCDDKARLFVALCLASGLEARIVPQLDRRTGDFVHVQAAVRWPGSERVPGAEADGWVRAELILSGLELGGDPRSVPRDAAGVPLHAGPWVRRC